MNQPETFSFLTDVHGNLQNIDAFLRESAERDVDHVIFGGDVMPKKMAVKFSEGNDAMAVSPTKMRGSAPDFSECKTNGGAVNLYEKGHMIFDTPFTLEQIQMCAVILEKLADRTDNMSSLNPDEILFLKQFGTQLIIKPLQSSQFGRKLFNEFCKQYNRSNWMRPMHSYKELLDRILEYLARLHIKGVKYASNFGGVNFQNIFSFIHANAPWEQWLNVYCKLDKHALEKQRELLRDFLNRITIFRETFRGSVSIILGNDDHIELKKDLDTADREGVITNATNRTAALSPRVHAVGYSCVPPILLDGIYDKWFKPEQQIGEELKSLLNSVPGDVQHVIANIHCPPFNTNLDAAINEKGYEGHYGSHEVRNCLEETQRKITVALFGHIHTAPEVSGTAQDKIGEIWIYNPGASEYEPRMLFGNLENPEEYSLVKP